jgi:hypothetical protein
MSEELNRRWLSRAAAVATHSLRFGLWCEALRTYPPRRAADLIDFVVLNTRSSSSAKEAYLPLVDRRSLLERVGPGKLFDILEAARAAELRGCQLALFSSGRPQVADEPGPPPDPISAQLSLGHQKTFARGTRSPIMERLLKSHDPDVVREILRNPRLREEEVVAIASRRPTTDEVFTYLGAAPKWIARISVQRAVVMNPYAAPSLSMALLVCLPAQDLREVQRDKKLHPAVRDGAREVLSWDNP